MSLLISTPTSLGILSHPTTSPQLTPFPLPSRLSQGTEISPSWSDDGNEVFVIPKDEKIGGTVFRYSWKGKRLSDLTLPPSVVSGKVVVEKVMAMNGKDGREFVIARKGELVVGKMDRPKASSEIGRVVEKLSVTRTYQTTQVTCTSLTSSITPYQTTIIAGYSNGELFIIRRDAKEPGEEVLRLNLNEYLDGSQSIPSSLRIHTEDSSMFLLPLSTTLLLINLPAPIYTTTATTSFLAPLTTPSADWVALLPCFTDQATIGLFEMSKKSEGCAVVQQGQEGRVCLISLEETNAEKREFTVGEEIMSLEYVTRDRLVIGTASGRLLMKDLAKLGEEAIEMMSTEGEEITGLIMQPGDPSSRVQSSRTTSRSSIVPRSSSDRVPKPSADSTTITTNRADDIKVSRSASVSVLRDGDGANRKGREDLKRRQVIGQTDPKSRHSIAGGTVTSSKQTDQSNLTLPTNPATANRRLKPEPPRLTSTSAMSRALSRPEATADASRSTMGIRSISGTSSSSSTSRRTSVAPSERTRDITLPSMSADSSSATIRPMHSSRQPPLAPTAKAEEIDPETAWALNFIRQQDANEEKQWDEWAERLVCAQDARGKMESREEKYLDMSEVERLRMEVVEVQMKSIRMARDLKTSMTTLLQPLHSELLSTKEIVSEQAREIERLRMMVGV